MQGKLIDLTGKRFEKWIVLRRVADNKWGQTMWLCRCDCGRERVVQGFNLRSGNSRSCKNCASRESAYVHGYSKTKLHNCWLNVRARCKPKNKYYGGRGIKVCSEWNNSFESFRDWALANGYKKGLEIDRIDNDGNYEPENCQFVTRKEQTRNSRNNRLIKIGKETKPLCEWAEQAGIKWYTLRHRIRAGWPEHRLLEPVGNI